MRPRERAGGVRRSVHRPRGGRAPDPPAARQEAARGAGRDRGRRQDATRRRGRRTPGERLRRWGRAHLAGLRARARRNGGTQAGSGRRRSAPDLRRRRGRSYGRVRGRGLPRDQPGAWRRRDHHEPGQPRCARGPVPPRQGAVAAQGGGQRASRERVRGGPPVRLPGPGGALRLGAGLRRLAVDRTDLPAARRPASRDRGGRSPGPDHHNGGARGAGGPRPEPARPAGDVRATRPIDQSGHRVEL